MSREKVIKSICHVPIDFEFPMYFGRKEREKITRKMKALKRSEKIRVDDLIRYIKNKPQLVEKWIHWCENKRGGFPVIFSEMEDGFEFCVLDKSLILRPIVFSESPELPCSLFIIFELGLFEQFFLFKLSPIR